MPYAYPTAAQAFKCLEICQTVSNTYRAVYVFRYDDFRGVIYIQAGTEEQTDELEFEVFRNGEWSFV